MSYPVRGQVFFDVVCVFVAVGGGKGGGAG